MEESRHCSGELGGGAAMTADIRPAEGVPPWEPSAVNFRPYSLVQAERQTRTEVQALVPPSIAVRLTRLIVQTYQLCNSSFAYSSSYNPKRYLTNPSAGVSNKGLDNKNSDLILAANDVLVNVAANVRYVVKEMLGHGTFGQVAKCWAEADGTDVAVKVIKNQPAYYHQALVEVELLTMLNRNFDPDDRHHIVRMFDRFLFQGHLCIAFELLSFNLFELVKGKNYRGISLKLLRLFTKQILDALGVLRDAGVIHCDLKPENILLTTSLQSAEIKLIDFGSACLENRTVYSYIQSRFYRSPEVVLGHPYTTAIDMWSLGCVAAELFLGLPLFPGESEYDLLQRMIETLGCQPPESLLRCSKHTAKYFKTVSAAAPSFDGAPFGETTYRFVTEKEYESREKRKPAMGKRYFKDKRLEDLIIHYPYKNNATAEEIEAERKNRVVFTDFLRGLVQLDPAKRWTPRQAAQHPFITEEPYLGPFHPHPEIAHRPVSQQMTVMEHHPGAGHWVAAGLSPQLTHMSARLQYGSPQFPTGPFSHASSYGSYGSYGSCDGFGSYSNDPSSIYFGYPTPPQPHHLAYDSWRRVAPGVPSAYGLGPSPSNSVLKPMSLGCSPSQLTPPGPQFLSPSSPSQSSPGRYGPPSPARLGKAHSHYKHVRQDRRGFCPPTGSFDGVRPHPPQPGFDGHNSHIESYGSNSRAYGQSSHLKPAKGKAGSSLSSAAETIPEAHDGEWGDWDPNYSLLLQEDVEPMLPGPSGVMGSGGARLGPGQGTNLRPSQGNQVGLFQAKHHRQVALSSSEQQPIVLDHHHHAFQLGRPTGGLTAAANTEQLDRHLTGIMLSSGIGEV